MRMKVFLLLFVFSFVSLVLCGSLKKEGVRVEHLDNGLKILLLEDHDIPNIALYTFFKVGARNERTGITGVSHFIEHMMFNGTEKFGPGKFDEIIEFLGGSNNAYTGHDMTAYTDWFPSDGLEKMIELESNRMQGLLFDPKVLEQERGVVTSERRFSTENNNERLLAEQVRATAITAHPYHWGVIGWMSDIRSWKRDEIIEYYQKFYAPNNAVLILVGDFEIEKALALIHKYYAGIPAGPKFPTVDTVEPPQKGPKRVVIRKKTQTPSFQMVYHAPACTDSDYYPLRILDIALFDGESSRLYRRLVRKEKLAISVFGGIDQTIDPDLFFISVKPRQNANLEKIERIIAEEINDIAKKGISEREIQKAVNIIKKNFYSRLQTIAGKANLLGRTEVLYGNYRKMFTDVEEFTKVSNKRIQEVTAKYFTENNKTVGVIIPGGGEK